MRRQPTPATHKIPPSLIFQPGKKCSNFNYDKFPLFTLAAFLTNFLSFINPLARQSIPDSSSIAHRFRDGFGVYFPPLYPTERFINADKSNAHYNPATSAKFIRGQSQHNHGPMPAQILFPSKPSFRAVELPTVCVRQIKFYKQCENVNGKDACHEEQDNIVALCPAFALSTLRENEILRKKLIANNNLRYEQAMRVSQENVNRTVADVPFKTWESGTSKHLRGDSFWCDDRYVDVTMAEVDSAKARVKARQMQSGYKPLTQEDVHIDYFDRTYAEPTFDHHGPY